MAKLKGHLPPLITTPPLEPSPARRPPLTPQCQWIIDDRRIQRLFQRELFLRTSTFKIVSRTENGGPAQLVRMVLHYGKIPYEMQVLTQVDWRALQQKTPYGDLPVLWLDHEQYGEPSSIVRHLSSHLGLLGANEPERFVVEAVMAQVEEIRDSRYIQKAFEELCEKRVDDNAELLLEVMIPRKFGYWEKQIESNPGPYILSSGISAADMAIFDFLNQHMRYLPLEPEVQKYPGLKRLLVEVPLHPRLVGMNHNTPASSTRFADPISNPHRAST